MNIAYFPMGSETWYGGVSHLRSIIHALRLVYGKEIKQYLAFPSCEANHENELRSITDGLIEIPHHAKGTMSWLFDRVASRLSVWDVRNGRYLREAKIDVLFGPYIQHRVKGIPALSHVSDFRHRRSGSAFNKKELAHRNQVFLQTALNSSRILIASEAIKTDFQTYLPRHVNKVRVSRPVIDIPESIYATEPEMVCKLYNLPQKFIYFPGQFWKHKNHQTVFNAIKKLKSQGTSINLVCTGCSEDRHNPEHFSDLINSLSDWDFKGQVIYLGILPYEHVLLLMRQSICVINPSLFEGFSLTVGEAKSLGKRVLLSTIPPHHEHQNHQAVFFNPHDVADLAGKIARVWAEAAPGPDPELEDRARGELPERIRNFAFSFRSVMEEVVS
jgi:glycosyltransferase involved in cell wall biosynthesis